MAEPLHVQIGEHAQQRRTHVYSAALAEVGETVETEEIMRLHEHYSNTLGRANCTPCISGGDRSSDCRQLKRAPLADR